MSFHSAILNAVGSLSLFQGNFLTQELNQGLLHCRWILYQLSELGNPTITLASFYYFSYIVNEENEAPN